MVYPPPSRKPFIPQPMERVEPELGVLATPPSQDGETGGVSGVQRGQERRTEPDDPESRVVRELCGSDGEGRVRGAGDKERGEGQPEEQERAGRGGLWTGAAGDRLEPNDPELGLRGPSSDGEGDVSDVWRPWESKDSSQGPQVSCADQSIQELSLFVSELNLYSRQKAGGFKDLTMMTTDSTPGSCYLCEHRCICLGPSCLGTSGSGELKFYNSLK